MSLLLLFAGSGPPHHEFLLDSAERLLKEEHPEAAVVTAQAACEVYTEQAISRLFWLRGAGFVAKPVDGFLQSYSLNNDKLRALYSALTNDPIEQQPVWQGFKKMSELRNGFAHSGKAVPPDEAARACESARQFITHLREIVSRWETQELEIARKAVEK